MVYDASGVNDIMNFYYYSSFYIMNLAVYNECVCMWLINLSSNSVSCYSLPHNIRRHSSDKPCSERGRERQAWKGNLTKSR